MKKEALRKFSDRAMAMCYIALIFTFSIPQFTSFNYDPNMNLSKLAPHLITFIYTFVTMGVFWVAQSRILHLISKVSMNMVWRYKSYFICLVLISLAAVSLSSDPLARLPLLGFGFLLLIAALLHVSFLYAALNKNGRQRDSLIISLKKTALAGPACYLLAIAACWISVYASFLCVAAATIFYMFFMRSVKVLPGAALSND